jgi:uncharacterized protein
MRTTLTLAAAMLWLAPSAPAALGVLASQQPEKASFSMIVNSDTILVERATRTAERLEGEFADRVRGGRVAYRATLAPNGLVVKLETTSWVAGADTTKARTTFTLSGDSVIVEGKGGRAHVPSVDAAMAYINPSPAFLELILLRARSIGGAAASFPLFIVGAGQSVPVTVTWIGSDSATIALAGVTMRAAVSPAGALLGMRVPAQQLRVVRGGELASLGEEKRDYAAPVGAPYTAHDVSITTPAGITLSGTLTIPAGRATGRAPAVVTITGSGQQDRDESLTGIIGYRLFRQVADTLARRGIAVLRLDDRGIGGSGGNPATSTSADFADDIRAAVAYLRTRPDIDGDRIGLVGHSEGAFIAPMVAETDARIRALVLLAGPSRTGRRVLEYQNAYAIDSVLHATGTRRDSLLRLVPKALDSLGAANAWTGFFLRHDPSATARRVHAPVLILQGETDHQVTPDQASELATAFRDGGNSNVTVRMFSATNHLFLADPNGDARGYAALPSKAVRVEVLGALADWLVEALKR